MDIQNRVRLLGDTKEFFDLKVNVFTNRANGQLMITLPKKKIQGVPSKINIKMPMEYLRQ